jgi:F0F1-type ATP synthase membrane subunit b/b'
MSILPDPLQTALNMVPFLVAILGMYFIILKPLIAYLEEREAAISGGRIEADKIQGRIDEKMDAYEAELARAKVEVATLRGEQRAEAQVAYDGVMTQAAAAKTLKASSAQLATQVASQVLGRPLEAR